MLRYPTLSFIVIFTYLINLVKADNAFAGCFSILPSATTQVTGSFGSATDCDMACPNNKHSFYQKSTSNCYCTDKYPSESYFQNGVADSCSNPAHYDARITHTSFIWRPTCYSTPPSGVTFSGLTGPDTCLKNCGMSIGATFYVSSVNGNYQCACGEPTSFGTPASTCGPGTYFYYYHTAAQASQGLSRKRRLEEERRRAIPTYCPKGLTPCKIQDISEAYECVDTSSELEACGGCLYGSLGSSNTTIGQDCTTLPAVLGGVTCENGQCKAYQCKPGYKLKNQQCVLKEHKKIKKGVKIGSMNL